MDLKLYPEVVEEKRKEATLADRVRSEFTPAISFTEERKNDVQRAVAGLNRDFSTQISGANKTYGLPENLLVNLLAVESSGVEEAIIPSGARGLGQLMPETARELGLRVDEEVDERADGSKNIDASAKYLARLIKAADGDVGVALARYDYGYGNVSKYAEDPTKVLPKETRDFGGLIMSYVEPAEE